MIFFLKLRLFCTRTLFLNTAEPLLWDTSFQGTPLFKGHKIWSRKNAHVIFVSITSLEGTPLFRGMGLFFLGPETTLNPPYTEADFHDCGQTI